MPDELCRTLQYVGIEEARAADGVGYAGKTRTERAAGIHAAGAYLAAADYVELLSGDSAGGSDDPVRRFV